METFRAIALEDLQGICKRVAVRRSQRTTGGTSYSMQSWAFCQLRCFVIYIAKQVGMPGFLVDPKYTSRTCPACGSIDKANCPSLTKFSCMDCGFAGLADHIAAINIGRRTAVNIRFVNVNRTFVARNEAKAVLTELQKSVVTSQLLKRLAFISLPPSAQVYLSGSIGKQEACLVKPEKGQAKGI